MATEILRDKNGRQIMPGDLLKSFHFRAANRRHGIQYLYHTVVEDDKGFLTAVPTSNLNPAHAESQQGGSCPVRCIASSTEIIAGYGRPRSNNWFREREREVSHV